MAMSNGTVLVVLGLVLLAGYAAHVVGARSHIPRVTLLLLLGVICGPQFLDLVPDQAADWFPLLAQFALAVVAFLLGEEFVHKKARHSPLVLKMAVVITLATAACVTLACLLAGASTELALVLGGIATATDPASTLDLIDESHAEGPLTDTILGIVTADDVVGIACFSLLLAAAEAMSGQAPPMQAILAGLREIGGGVALGVALGLPMAWLTGRLRPGEPAALEALGFVFLTSGLASLLHVSFLLACMALGATVAIRAKHYKRAIHEIEGLSTPLLVLFFVFAGFHLDLLALPAIGLLGGAYVVARILGRMTGSATGGTLFKSPPAIRTRLGWCLLPQAGVSLGLALLAAQQLPTIAGTLMPLIIATTVFFEVVGPITTRWHLGKAGEVPATGSGETKHRNR